MSLLLVASWFQAGIHFEHHFIVNASLRPKSLGRASVSAFRCFGPSLGRRLVGKGQGGWCCGRSISSCLLMKEGVHALKQKEGSQDVRGV